MWRKRPVLATASLLAFAGIAGAVIAAVLIARGASGARASASVPAGATLLTVGPPVGSEALAPGFLGLSIEYWAFENYAGKNPNAVDPVFVRLVRNLTPGQSAVIRLGGVTTDRTWWSVAGLPRPAGAIYTLTPRRLAVARAVADQVGARLILGVQFEADSTVDAAAEEQAMLRAVGPRRIEAFELGNEPELYGSWAWYRKPGTRGVPGRPPGYGIGAFTKDYGNVAAAMPAVPLAGPATGANGWVNGLGTFISSEPRLRLVTVHRYPLQACYFPAGSPRYPTMSRLLARSSSIGLADSLVPFLTVARQHGVGVRVDEMNNISCGPAPGVTDSFGMALWVLDALFADLQVGVQGVNIHTYPGADYELFKFSHSASGWRAAVEPEYYGLLMFARAAPPGSRLLGISGPGSTATLRAWATRTPAGVTHVVMINEDPAHARVLAIRLPHGGPATLERLQAPNVHTTSGVSLAGQSFGDQTATGALAGSRRIYRVTARNGIYLTRLPADSAALLTVP